jgi:hypothetical protein
MRQAYGGAKAPIIDRDAKMALAPSSMGPDFRRDDELGAAPLWPLGIAGERHKYFAQST